MKVWVALYYEDYDTATVVAVSTSEEGARERAHEEVTDKYDRTALYYSEHELTSSKADMEASKKRLAESPYPPHICNNGWYGGCTKCDGKLS